MTRPHAGSATVALAVIIVSGRSHLHGERVQPFRRYSSVETRFVGVEPLQIAQCHVCGERQWLP
jgi:hypothetical protein